MSDMSTDISCVCLVFFFFFFFYFFFFFFFFLIVIFTFFVRFFKLFARYRIGPGEEPARYIVTIGKWVKWVFFTLSLKFSGSLLGLERSSSWSFIFFFFFFFFFFLLGLPRYVYPCSLRIQ
jgi:phosphatidylglycerophosphate synthase